jgi:hypothetical protein
MTAVAAAETGSECLTKASGERYRRTSLFGLSVSEATEAPLSVAGEAGKPEATDWDVRMSFRLPKNEWCDVAY